MSEESVLKKIRRWCEPTQLESTTLGIGDDAAVVKISGKEFHFCSDLMIEHTHFDLKFSTPADVGYKALARCLSDIAAMGGQPLGVTVSIALPRAWTPTQIETFLEGFYQGAVDISRITKAPIVGGDLSRIDGPIVIDIAATGEVRNTWRRSTAKPGDLAFITGPLGTAAYALKEMQDGRQESLAESIAAKHLRPLPRFDISNALSKTPIVGAMDISDGLAQDARRLCQESNVSLVMNPDLIPAPHGLDNALYGGDDYELLIVVPSAWAASSEAHTILERVGATRIGHFETHAPSLGPSVYLESNSTPRQSIANATKTSTGHDPF